MAGSRKRNGWLVRTAYCVILFAASLSSHAALLRTAAQEGTEPKFIAVGKGRIVGLCVDIMRAVEQIDASLQFTGDQRWKPLIRAYSELESGQQDVQCAVQRSPEREQRFHFLGPPLYTVDYHFLARINDPVVIRNWDDVRRRRPTAWC